MKCVFLTLLFLLFWAFKTRGLNQLRMPRISRIVNDNDKLSMLSHNSGIPSAVQPKSKASIYEPYSPVGIQFHGGEVLGAGLHVYIVWYGMWSSVQKRIIRNFINSMSSQSPDVESSVRRWWTMNSLYFNKFGASLSSEISLQQEIDDHYSFGRKNLSDSAISSIVFQHLVKGRLPADPKGVYLVLSSPDVTKSGFCDQFCGYHDTFKYNNVGYKFAFIGNPTQCPNTCQPYQSEPNGDPGIDGMVSVIAHELAETVTDPTGMGWWDSANGDENGDKCIWSYGCTFMDINGNPYNVIGEYGKVYLIQLMWNPKTGSCSKHP